MAMPDAQQPRSRTPVGELSQLRAKPSDGRTQRVKKQRLSIRERAMIAFDVLAAQAALHGLTVEKISGPIRERPTAGGYYRHRDRHIAVRTDVPDPIFPIWALCHEIGHAFRYRHIFDDQPGQLRYQSDRNLHDESERQAERFTVLLAHVIRARHGAPEQGRRQPRR